MLPCCPADRPAALLPRCTLCDARLLSWTDNEYGECLCPRHAGELPPCVSCGRPVPAGAGRATSWWDGLLSGLMGAAACAVGGEQAPGWRAQQAERCASPS